MKSSYGASSSASRHSMGRDSPARSNASASNRSYASGMGASYSNEGGSHRDDDGSDVSFEDQEALPGESAQVRYARLKQRNQNASGRSRMNGATLNNTSVNIANAFNQAAESSFNLHHVSDSDRYPRKETHVPPPPRQSAAPSSSRIRSPGPMPPPPRTQAAPHPDRRRDRATSPVIDAIAGAARALSPVSFLLKPRVGRQNEFPEDDEEDEHQSQYQSFASMGGSGDGGERLYDGSFLSATTVAGDSSVGEGSRSFGASGATGSNYSFQEEERLMREIEEKKRTAAKKGKSGVGGWFSSLAGVGSSQPKSPIDPPQTPPHTSESQDDDESSELEPEEEGEEEEEEFRPGGELSDEEEVPIKTTSRRRPRVSHDNQAFKYQPGDLASENSESDGDGGRRRRRRKSGSLGRLRAEGMVPVMEGKKRKGKKGSRRNTAGGSAEMVDDDEEEEDDADETFDGAQYHQDRAPDETDESFVIQMHQQERQRQASHQPLVSTQSKKPFFASSSPLPTHFKTRSGPLHLLQRILAFVYTFLLSIGRKVVRAPLEMADGTRTSLGLVDWGQAMRVLGAALLLGTIASLINPSISSSRTSIPLAHNHSTHHHPSSASSWNPFRAQPSTPSTSSPSYKTPDLPPDSMDELLSRLTSLESALGFLSSQTSASTYSAADADSRLSTVDSRLSSELRRLSTVISQHSQEEKVRLQSLDRVVGRIRGDVDALNGRVKSIAKKTEENEEVVAKLDVSVEGVKTAVKGLTERVKEAERVAKEASDANRIAEIATEAIEGYLPSKLVVKLNPKTKQLDVDPAFWTALRSVFVEQSQLAPAVSSEVDKLRSSLAPSWKSSPSPPTPVVVHQPTPPAPPPTWSDFLASNEAALHAWSEAELEQQAQTGAVVSRKTFLDILHRELESLKVDLSRHVDQSSQQLSSDILAKSRQASEALVDSKLASHQPASSSPPSSSSSSDPQISTSLLQTLIDSALLKYSKDTLARTDFALYTAGGRVIPSITSDTYEISTASSPSFFDRLIPGKSKGSITGRPPVTALHPDTNLGNCWPFKGASGQLGVLLARPAVVRAVTVEHAAREVSLDMAAAPRDVEIWGLVESPIDRAKVAAHQEASELSSPSPSTIPPSPNHVLLGSFAYDIDSSNHIQTFDVPQDVQDLGVATGIIVVKINSNYGADYTCLYRVRVHGDLVDKPFAE